MTGSMMERLEENKFLITQSPSHLITLKEVVCGFHLNNIRRVGKAERAHRNVGNSQQTELTPLTTLTFAACKHEPFASCKVAETRMNTAFAGGGGSNSNPSKAFRHIATKQSLQHKPKTCA